MTTKTTKPMTQQTEKICFRYDGSKEAKKCIEWINRRFHKGLLTQYEGIIDRFYDDNGNSWKVSEPQPPMRLVTPSEFLRLVKGDAEWTPKYGEEVEVSDGGETWNLGYYCSPNPHPQTKDEFPHVVNLVHTKYGGGGAYRYIRPIRKSVREEIYNSIENTISCYIPTEDIDRIIDIIKQRKDEL